MATMRIITVVMDTTAAHIINTTTMSLPTMATEMGIMMITTVTDTTASATSIFTHIHVVALLTMATTPALDTVAPSPTIMVSSTMDTTILVNTTTVTTSTLAALTTLHIRTHWAAQRASA